MNNTPQSLETKKSILPLNELTSLLIDKDSPLEKLDVLYLQIEGKAREMIIWYLTRKRLPAMCSRILRFLAIFFAGMGTISPLLQSFNPHFTQIGYVSLGLVAIIVGFDKFFGFSNAWMRYMLTEIRLQKKLAAFQLEWLKQRSFIEKDLTQAQAEQLFDFLQAFQVELLTDIEQEIHIWVEEFQSNLINLDKISKEQEATKK